MPKRPKIPTETETAVLTKCRRKCCLCFALKSDDGEKRGQIAHLDDDPSNNDEDNLAFLCMDHHDIYDGRTSQSKGVTIHEAKFYRQLLHERIKLEDAMAIDEKSPISKVIKAYDALLQEREKRIASAEAEVAQHTRFRDSIVAELKRQRGTLITTRELLSEAIRTNDTSKIRIAIARDYAIRSIAIAYPAGPGFRAVTENVRLLGYVNFAWYTCGNVLASLNAKIHKWHRWGTIIVEPRIVDAAGVGRADPDCLLLLRKADAEGVPVLVYSEVARGDWGKLAGATSESIAIGFRRYYVQTPDLTGELDCELLKISRAKASDSLRESGIDITPKPGALPN